MPSMMTHRLFADDALDNMMNGVVKTAIDRAFALYSIGSSGPDFFFFFGVWPWRNQKKAKQVHQYGSLMHVEKIDILFKTLFTMCKETKNPFYIAYTSGVIAHWCLDHIAHPYVFNQVGADTKKSDRVHCFFESMLDRELLDKKGIDLKKCKTYDVVSYQSTTHEAIYDLYSAVLKKGWDIELQKKDVRQCLVDFYQVEKFLYDPKGHKYPWIARLEKVLGLEGVATSMLIPMKEKVIWDVMNEQRRLWHHPQTNEEHHETFMELYEQALQIAKQVFMTFEGYLDDKQSLEDTLSLIQNKNFHTGLNEPQDLKYFDFIL